MQLPLHHRPSTSSCTDGMSDLQPGVRRAHAQAFVAAAKLVSYMTMEMIARSLGCPASTLRDRDPSLVAADAGRVIGPSWRESLINGARTIHLDTRFTLCGRVRSLATRRRQIYLWICGALFLGRGRSLRKSRIRHVTAPARPKRSRPLPPSSLSPFVPSLPAFAL
ncbi:hypothetical protein AB1Y20_006711 [Prymnesium parvum]|uniref:Uncharacterized protein n=1 Tax=Prymnesium parvum TaxID=97485 RepID=A0AB34IZ75_PRYPA